MATRLRVILLVFALLAAATSATRITTSRVSEAQVDLTPTPTYWIPTVPPNLALQYYIGWPAEDVATDIVERIKEVGDAIGDVQVEAAVDLYPDDGASLGLTYDYVAWGAEPDVVIVLSGSFRVFRPRGIKEAPYYLLVVDRETGGAVMSELSYNLEELLSQLPGS